MNVIHRTKPSRSSRWRSVIPPGLGRNLRPSCVADPDVRAAASLIVVGDRRVLELGALESGIILDIDVRSAEDGIAPGRRPVLIDLGHLDPATIERGVAAEPGGRFALENFSTCLKLAAAGKVGAVCFTPFNKAAMRLSHPPYDDEIGYVAGILGTDSPASEFNVLEGLWNARVTSHVPLSRVASLISTPQVLERHQADRCVAARGRVRHAPHRRRGP